MKQYNVVFYNEDSNEIITDSIVVIISANDEAELDTLIEKDYKKLTDIYAWYQLQTEPIAEMTAYEEKMVALTEEKNKRNNFHIVAIIGIILGLIMMYYANH